MHRTMELRLSLYGMFCGRICRQKSDRFVISMDTVKWDWLDLDKMLAEI